MGLHSLAPPGQHSIWELEFLLAGTHGAIGTGMAGRALTASSNLKLSLRNKLSLFSLKTAYYLFPLRFALPVYKQHVNLQWRTINESSRVAIFQCRSIKAATHNLLALGKSLIPFPLRKKGSRNSG